MSMATVSFAPFLFLGLLLLPGRLSPPANSAPCFWPLAMRRAHDGHARCLPLSRSLGWIGAPMLWRGAVSVMVGLGLVFSSFVYVRA